ncbi:hypothetical protein FQR65_LT11552 [Abscondita terminalis]|nr:hypothetical protein FQR65_LT11552 [Abscondita terminalis]
MGTFVCSVRDLCNLLINGHNIQDFLKENFNLSPEDMVTVVSSTEEEETWCLNLKNAGEMHIEKKNALKSNTSDIPETIDDHIQPSKQFKRKRQVADRYNPNNIQSLRNSDDSDQNESPIISKRILSRPPRINCETLISNSSTSEIQRFCEKTSGTNQESLDHTVQETVVIHDSMKLKHSHFSENDDDLLGKNYFLFHQRFLKEISGNIAPTTVFPLVVQNVQLVQLLTSSLRMKRKIVDDFSSDVAEDKETSGRSSGEVSVFEDNAQGSEFEISNNVVSNSEFDTADLRNSIITKYHFEREDCDNSI